MTSYSVQVRERYRKLQTYYPLKKKQKKQKKLPSLKVVTRVWEKYELLKPVESAQLQQSQYARTQANAQPKLSGQDILVQMAMHKLGLKTTNLDYKDLRRMVSRKARKTFHLRTPVHTGWCVCCQMPPGAMMIVQNEMLICGYCLSAQKEEEEDEKTVFRWKIKRTRWGGEEWTRPTY